MDSLILDDDGSDAPGDAAHDPDAGDLVVDDPVETPTDEPAAGRRRRHLLAGAVLALLLTGVAAVPSLGWIGANDRADALAAELTKSRAEVTKQVAEASRLQKEVSNLQADKTVLNIHVQELQGEKDALLGNNEDLSGTIEEIKTVVKLLDQCLTDTEEIGGQLLRNPGAVSEERIRKAATGCATAQAAAKVLKAMTTPDDGKAV